MHGQSIEDLAQLDIQVSTIHDYQKRHHHHRKPVLVGDGNPEQRHLWIRISCAYHCDHCEIDNEWFIFSWSSNARAHDLHKPTWTSGGFEVEPYFKIPVHTSCEGHGGSLCVWYDMVYTQYTVQHPDGGPYYQISSPNKNNAVVWVVVAWQEACITVKVRARPLGTRPRTSITLMLLRNDVHLLSLVASVLNSYKL